MDIFKLFFNHDQRLDKLAKRNANKTKEEVEASLKDFMTPAPTFSKFYITGTHLDEEKFGINALEKHEQVLETLDAIFEGQHIRTSSQEFQRLSDAISDTKIGQAMLLTASTADLTGIDLGPLEVGSESNVGHLKDELREVLLGGHMVMYKEQAHHGFDLHLFSKENIYPQLFHPLQQLVDKKFRFFSINSKRMQSEKHFYFETWTLDRPPHGAEEVFHETVL
jgi:hypothetical protein